MANREQRVETGMAQEMKDDRSFYSLGRRRKDDKKKKCRSSKRTK